MTLGNDSLRQKEQRAFNFQSDFIQIAASKGNTTYFLLCWKASIVKSLVRRLKTSDLKWKVL